MNDPALGEQQSAFKDKWDSSSKHETETASNTVYGLQASHSILEALKTKRKSETAQWLSGLEKEITIMDTVAPTNSINNLSAITSAQGAAEEQSNADNTMIGQAIRWLDRMFVEFELYAAQFNLTVRGTNLVVSCTRPIKRSETYEGPNAETDYCLNYAGHITTQFWSLVIRGSSTKVEVFIIPADLLIAFSMSSADESGYEPLLVLEPAWQNNEIIWHMQGHVISTDQIPALAKELFGDLIKVASGQMSESEVLANPVQTISSNENPITPPPERHIQTKPASAPLIADLVNNNSKPANPPLSGFSPTNSVLSSAESKTAAAPFLALESLNVAKQLLPLIDKDINQLMETGKRSLESDDAATFEQVKELTGKLDFLRKGISNILASIQQANSR